jgi:hypothetical protein
MLTKLIRMGDGARCAGMQAESILSNIDVEPYREPNVFIPSEQAAKFFAAIGTRDPNELLTEIRYFRKLLADSQAETQEWQAKAEAQKRTIDSLQRGINDIHNIVEDHPITAIHAITDANR